MKTKRHLACIILTGILVGIHNGRIAIWVGEDPEPKTVLPYPAELLPDTDRSALEKGIHLKSRQELIRFIEDHCS